jgi:glycine betaine/proline transport system ATP-binding protein
LKRIFAPPASWAGHNEFPTHNRRRDDIPKLEAESIYKIFGDAPDDALQMLRDGASKDEILSQTGQTVGVQDVSFKVEEGETFVVMGLSGSGKSTLVRILNRLIPATSGSLSIDGQDLLAADEATLRDIRLRKIAMVFQHFALFPHRTVQENTEYGLKIQGVAAGERQERARKALEQVGLDAWADRRPDNLSGGMQQRVGLARALAVDPEVLLMDEPFSALDPLIRREMQNELLELQRTLKKTIIFITHDLHEALTLGDKIAIMKEGRFVQVGTAEDIVGDPADDYVAAFTQDIDRARVFSTDRILEETKAIAPGSKSCGEALAQLDQTGRTAVHIGDDSGLKGIASAAALTRTLQDKGAETPAEEAMTEDYPSVAPGTHLYRLYGLCARDLPVAVEAEDGKIHGVVTPQAVFEELSHAEGNGDDDSSNRDAA